MENATQQQRQKSGRKIHCFSDEGASWDGRRADQLFAKNLSSAVEFFA